MAEQAAVDEPNRHLSHPTAKRPPVQKGATSTMTNTEQTRPPDGVAGACARLPALPARAFGPLARAGGTSDRMSDLHISAQRAALIGALLDHLAEEMLSALSAALPQPRA